MHVLANGSINQGGCSPERLRGWLAALPAKLGMTIIPPQKGLTENPVVTEAGPVLVGFVLLAESHCVVHLDLRQGRFYADAFTCRAFDPQAFCEELAALNLTVEHVEVLSRGLEYLIGRPA